MKRKIKSILAGIFIMAMCCDCLYASDAVLKWDAATGDVSGYTVYYGTSQGSYPSSQDVGNVTQYALSNFSLSEGTTYYFVVRAYNSVGESGDSNVTTYTMPSSSDTTPPMPPQEVSGSVVDSSILIQWQANSETDLSGYRVYYGTASRSYGLPISVTGTQYSLSGLQTDVAYYIAVSAVDTSGNESGYSSPEVIKTITVTVSGPTLKWDAASGDVSGYKIYYSTIEGEYTDNVDVGDVTQYALENFSLTEGITYYFVVRAYNASGESGDSNVTTYMIGDPAPPEDTTAPVVTITSPTWGNNYQVDSDSLSIGGTASDEVGVTFVSWSNNKGGSGTATGTTSWNIAGITLLEGSNTITVTAEDAAGNISTDTLTVLYEILDTTAPVITIESPTSNTTYNTSSLKVDISGTASDNNAIAQITWSSSKGGSGTAVGTSNWSITGIVMVEGENIITITARDEAGNTSTDTLNVIHTVSSSGEHQIQIRIDSGIDDVEERLSTGWMYTNSSDLELADDSGTNQLIGLRFKGVSIPKGSIIQNAYIEFETDEVKSEATTLHITAQEIDNAPEFTTDTGYLSDQTTLGTSVAWNNIPAWDTMNQKHHTPNIASVIQQIVSRPGWEAGNAIAIIINGSGVRTAESFDGEQGAAPLLYIEYSLSNPADDTVAPVVNITSPTSGTSYDTESSNINLSGTATDDTGTSSVTWSNSKGGSGTASGTANWNIADITLAEGENVITVLARDAAGNISTDTLTVVYTFTVTIEGPTLKWDAASGDVSGYKIYYSTVEGEYTDNVDAGNVTQYSLENLPLSEGITYYFVVRAYNATGESGDSNVTTYMIGDPAPPEDTTAPVITITSPTWGDNYPKETDTIDIGGTASDEAGVASVKWVSDKGANGTASGTTTWSITGITLVEGPNVITVTAEDTSGNTSIDTLTVWYEIPDTTAPVVTITSPTSGTNYDTESGSISLTGTATDDTGTSSVTWSNSRGGSGTASGTESWSVSAVPLGEGENVITIAARDEAGNSSTDVLTVIYTVPDTTAPVVTITSPTTDSSYGVDTSSLEISGTASDETGVVQVTWSNSRGGSGTASGTENWTVSGIALGEGENLITVTAKDASGNASMDTLMAVYTIPDTTAPVVTIASPTTETSYNTESGNVNLSGTATDDTGINSITWSNSRGGSGTAAGTTSWNISSLSLAEGENLITVKAKDTSGNVSTDTLTVVYFVPVTIKSEKWTELSNDDFESGWGSFRDGGVDCRRSARDARFAHQGTYCARIRDNSGGASAFKYRNSVDVRTPGYSQIKIAFWYYPLSMENKEDFFVEFFDGSRWIKVGRYIKGTDFSNGRFYQEKGILINKDEGVVFPTNMKIRFRCDASGNRDKIYIDEVVVSAR